MLVRILLPGHIGEGAAWMRSSSRILGFVIVLLSQRSISPGPFLRQRKRRRKLQMLRRLSGTDAWRSQRRIVSVLAS